MTDPIDPHVARTTKAKPDRCAVCGQPPVVSEVHHPRAATLHLGGAAWAHPDLEPLIRDLYVVHDATGEDPGALIISRHPENPRRGDHDAIVKSVLANGVYTPPKVQRSTTYVLAGNHSFDAMVDAGATRMPWVWLDVDDREARRIMADDNRTAELGGYDQDMLLENLRALDAVGDLDLTAWGADDLAELERAAAASTYTAPVDSPSLADRFVIPPFTVLDARAGAWQDRKRRWLSLGIQSEVGRGVEVSPHPEAAEEVTERVADASEGSPLWMDAREALAAAVKAKGWRHRDLDDHLGTNGMAGHYLGRAQPAVPTPEQWNRLVEVLDLPDHLYQPMTQTHTRPGRDTATGRGPSRTIKGQEGLTAIKPNLSGALSGDRGAAHQVSSPYSKGNPRTDEVSRKIAATGARTLGQGLQASRDPETGDLVYTETTAAGVSIFDPVVCELAYRWFSPLGGHVLDPFAGGSVRGIVAAALGRHYTGVELRGEQVDANEAQRPLLDTVRAPGGVTWVQGDSTTTVPDLDVHADLVFSCPPYADLEVYSDDPADLSAMTYDDFLTAYRLIIRHSIDRLRDDRFAVWVVGEVRDRQGRYRDFIGDTVQAFRDAGAAYYNEAILVTPVGSLPIRAGRQFDAGRKLGKTHQQVLVFCKGDPKAATAACGTVDTTWPDADEG